MKRFFLVWLGVILLSLSALAYGADEPLPPEQAFKVTAQNSDGQVVQIRIDIAPGYYLYRDQFAFALDPASFQADKPTLPAGLEHKDAYYGTQIIYRGKLDIALPYKGPASGPEKLHISLRGCADRGICYPPTTFDITVEAANQSLGTRNVPGADWRSGLNKEAMDTPQAQAPVVGTPAQADAAASAPISEDASQIARLLRGGNLALIALSFFGFGLLLCFTPCTLPMVPIISGIIVGHGHKISHTRAFVLSSAYVLGMAVVYALAGVLAGFSGQLLSAWLQNAWVLGAFALIFVLLALAMFGVYELQLPTSWQHRLSSQAHHHSGSAHQLALMGAISALIVGPCVAAPLAGALIYIAQTHDALLGGLALFMLGLGMGAPLVLVGVAARRFLPKPGGWMEGVRRFFGLVLLGTALYIVSPVLPPVVPMLGWAVLLVTCGVFLRALDALPDAAHATQRVLKAIGILVLLAGAAIFVGALAGSRNPLQPLAGLRVANASVIKAPAFVRIKNTAELDAQIAASARPVMLDFYADWCVSCKEMESQTFTDPVVARQLSGFTLLQVDVTANTPDDRALLARFGLFGPPGILFFAPGGDEKPAQRVIGFMAAERFGPRLQEIANAR
ncbi:protein-disulfide reductase DsbD [Uliginosibacterium gangwonense]|uniref:protein-disulfide reductase DsbD n=1 Tax=Uliginosibacterium gangwonense TaxID=392736 RepID=UPI0003829F06|nr:protein-disulfide reductase DsbD [Uliginosibacterium gangwonense]